MTCIVHPDVYKWIVADLHLAVLAGQMLGI